MDLKSIPGSGRLAGKTRIITGAVVVVLGAAAHLTGSDTLWAVVQQIAPLLLSGG